MDSLREYPFFWLLWMRVNDDARFVTPLFYPGTHEVDSWRAGMCVSQTRFFHKPLSERLPQNADHVDGCSGLQTMQSVQTVQIESSIFVFLFSNFTLLPPKF